VYLRAKYGTECMRFQARQLEVSSLEGNGATGKGNESVQLPTCRLLRAPSVFGGETCSAPIYKRVRVAWGIVYCLRRYE